MVNEVTLYGIPNCDTIKKARAWLDDHGIAYSFYDYRKQGLDYKQLQSMVSALGWEAMLNRRGTTWRALSSEIRDHVDADSAMRVMLENPVIIKRPILAADDRLHLGFSDAQYREIFD